MSNDLELLVRAYVDMAQQRDAAATGMLPESVPKAVRNFLTGCMLVSPAGRPDDAWDLHEEFDKVLRKLIGRPRYRALAMPTDSPA